MKIFRKCEGLPEPEETEEEKEKDKSDKEPEKSDGAEISQDETRESESPANTDEYGFILPKERK